MTRTVRKVARTLHTPGRAGMRLRQGVVQAVNADRTVDVTIGGGAATVAAVPCLTSAVPVVGGSVLLIGHDRDLFVLGSVADNTSHGFTPLMQYGTVTISLTAQAENTATVTFGWAFPSAPMVLVSTQKVGTKVYDATAGTFTASNFIARASTFDGSNATASVDVRWIAVHAGG